MVAEEAVEVPVREALRQHLRLDAPPADDAPLLSSGLVDSLGVLELVAAIESATGVSIDVTEMTLENLDSVSRIAALVRRRKGGASAGRS